MQSILKLTIALYELIEGYINLNIMDKLIGQIARISKFGFILNSIDNLECTILYEKHFIQLLLYENGSVVLEETVDKIREKSEDYLYKEINLLCNKLILYRNKYEL